MAGARVPHVILLEDFAYYDDETEYMKRYYKYSEAKPRIENITKFYFTLTQGAVRPTFPPHRQSEILLKRNEEMNQLLIAKLQNLAQTTPREPNQIANTDSNKANKFTVNYKSNIANWKKEIEQVNEQKKEDPKLVIKDDVPIKDTVQVVKANLEIVENTKTEQKPVEKVNIEPEENKEKKWLNKFRRFSTNDNDGEEVNQNFFKKHQPKAQVTNVQPVVKVDKKEPVKEPSVEEIKTKNENPVDLVVEEVVKAPVVPSAPVNKRASRRREIRSDIFFEIPRHVIQPESKPQNRLDINEPVDVNPEKVSSLLRTTTEEVKEVQNDIKQIDQQMNDALKELEAKKRASLPDNVSFSKKEIESSVSENNDSHNVFEVAHEPAKGVEPTQYDMIFSQNASKPPSICFKETETGKAPELIVQNFTESNEKSTNTEHHESSTTHIHISDENTSRPMITIQNIQINKINPIDTHNTSNDVQHVSKKSEYVKELMRKHYKLSDDDVKGLSRPLTERFKGSTIFAKLNQANQKSKEQPLKNRDMYINTNLRSNLTKEALKHKKTSSISDFNISQGTHTVRSHHSPKNSINIHNGSVSTRRQLSPSSERVQAYSHLKTNEGTTVIQESLKSTTGSTFKSPGIITESQELITTDMLKDLGKNYKTVSTYKEKTSIYKHHHKSKSIHYVSSENSLKLYNQTEETKVTVTAENLPSTRNKSKNENSQASSRFNFKLDLGSIGQITQPDSTLGLFSSKSGKINQTQTPLNSHREPNEKQTPRFQKDFYMQSQYSQTTRNQLRSPGSPRLLKDKKISRNDLIQNVVNSNKTRKVSYGSLPQSQIQSFSRPETTPEKRVVTNSRAGLGSSLVRQDLNKKTKR